MITVFSTQHTLRSPRTELYGGELVRPHESPQRAQVVLERVETQRLGQVIAPANFGLFSNMLLVGNFGNGRINAFDPGTGASQGQSTGAVQ